MKIFKYFTLILIFLIALNVESKGLNPDSGVYYVDNVSGDDSNNGNTPAEAWKSIKKINSFTFSPGDRLLFKRGGIWFETLKFNGNGSSNNRITISDYGSGALPVLDGGLARPQCMVLENSSYITVSNLQMQNALRQGAIRILRGNNIVVENCIFNVTGHGGVFIENSNNCIIRNNNITTAGGFHNNQTDGIYSQRNNNITFDNNTIIINNEHPDQHCDGIQSFKDANITICNNYVEQRNGKTSNAQGIYATTMLGTHTYYNNVVYCPNTRSAVMGFRNLKEGRGFLKAYHNTLVGGGNNILFVSEDAGVEAKNNIFYTTSKSTPVRLETSQVVLDNNLYYHNGNGNVVGFKKGMKSKNVNDLKREGIDRNGMFGDPSFSKEFYPLKNSPAVDRAIVLGPPFDKDKLGRKRSSGKAPDIGAYEILK